MKHPCPHCRANLESHRARAGLLWICPDCQGRAITLPVLRNLVQPPVVSQIWGQLLADGAASRHPCPVCLRPMRALIHSDAEATLELDACRGCQLIWFDARELAQLPARPPPEKPRELVLPPHLREKLALAKIEKIRSDAIDEDWREALPQEPWKAAAALFGMPVEQDSSVSSTPWVTWTAVLLCVIAFGVSLHLGLRDVVKNWGLIPLDSGRHAGLTWITSIFLHGGWAHLLGNMYFLLVFGDNVEECLGRVRYLALLLGAALAGALAHAWFDPRPDLPVVGASAAISGVIVYYALRFPDAKLGFLFRIGLWFRWLAIPALGLLVIWLLLQGVMAWQQLTGYGHVSALAHLGGALTGLAFWSARKV
jgi:membrane associated rhomboid family serine protease